jgi:hypothetical protein
MANGKWQMANQRARGFGGDDVLEVVSHGHEDGERGFHFGDF